MAGERKKGRRPFNHCGKAHGNLPHTKKILKVSTPTIDGISRIQHEYAQGSMDVWKLPCPGCGEYQELQWAHIKYKRLDDGKLDKSNEILCFCESCGELFNELSWKNGEGEWFSDVENDTIKSFRLNALVSPWMSWVEIVEEFISSYNDSEMLKVWTNTILGQVWTVDGESIDHNELFDRREQYNAVLPDGVLVLTAGVDVQDNRLEMEVVGWGENEVSWGIEYKVIHGNTAHPETWERLDQHLKKTYLHADGNILSIERTCIDSGGHRTPEVYQFCKDREYQGVYAIKGKGGTGMNILHSQSYTKRIKNLLFTIAVDTAKARLYARLAEKEPTKAGYCHFPIDSDEFQRGYDEQYFEGLTSEVKTVKMVRGRAKTDWVLKKGARNEPLDCRVYNIAAIRILNPNFAELKKRASSVTTKPRRRRGTISRGVDV